MHRIVFRDADLSEEKQKEQLLNSPFKQKQLFLVCKKATRTYRRVWGHKDVLDRCFLTQQSNDCYMKNGIGHQLAVFEQQNCIYSAKTLLFWYSNAK